MPAKHTFNLSKRCSGFTLLLGCEELVISKTDLARRLNLTQPAVSIAVRRGEKIARENQYQLIGD